MLLVVVLYGEIEVLLVALQVHNSEVGDTLYSYGFGVGRGQYCLFIWYGMRLSEDIDP